MTKADETKYEKFERYSQRHKTLSWWGMTVLVALPLLLFLARKPILALVFVVIFFGFALLDPVSRDLLIHVPPLRKRMLASLTLYVVVAGVFLVHPAFAIVVLVVGIAYIGLTFSKETKVVEKRIMEFGQSQRPRT